jgi:hypothetical protein
MRVVNAATNLTPRSPPRRNVDPGCGHRHAGVRGVGERYL